MNDWGSQETGQKEANETGKHYGGFWQIEGEKVDSSDEYSPVKEKKSTVISDKKLTRSTEQPNTLPTSKILNIQRIKIK